MSCETVGCCLCVPALSRNDTEPPAAGESEALVTQRIRTIALRIGVVVYWMSD